MKVGLSSRPPNLKVSFSPGTVKVSCRLDVDIDIESSKILEH